MTEPTSPPSADAGAAASASARTGNVPRFWDIARRAGRVVAINLTLLGLVCAHNWSRLTGATHALLSVAFVLALGAPGGALWACGRRLDSAQIMPRAYRLVTWAVFVPQALLIVILAAVLLRSR